MRIVNKKKFVRSMVLIVGLVILMLFFINTPSFSHKEVDYKNLYVSNGDTLWSIAEIEKTTNAYFENKDIRDIVLSLKVTNGLNNSDLQVNQKLKVPTL